MELKDLFGIGNKKLLLLNENNIYTIKDLLFSKYYDNLNQTTKNIIYCNNQDKPILNLINYDKNILKHEKYIIFDIEFYSFTGTIISICAINENGEYFKEYIKDFDILTERELIFNFIKFVDKRICFHWGNADKIIMYKSKSKLNIDFTINTFDLFNFCKTNQIYFKNSLNYKLKNIGNALFQNNLSTFKHAEAYEGYDLYLLFKKWYNECLIPIEEIKHILVYNYEDVILLEEIYKLIKE